MSLAQRLMDDMKAAMKAGEEGKARLSVIRMARAAIKNAEIDRQTTLDDAAIMEILAKEVKWRKEAIAEAEKAGRLEAVKDYPVEVAILEEYLPKQLTEDEVRAIARDIIAKVGAAGPKDLGKVMGPVIAATKGRADGKLVNQVVKDLLG
jgi:uncharacterized protein YqeY